MADQGKKVGEVTHYYDRLGVAIVKIEDDIKVGDNLLYKKGDREYQEAVAEMQSEHQMIDSATQGDEVGIKVAQKVKKGDQVFLVE